MSLANSTLKNSGAAFWGRYLERLEKKQVKESARRWYVRRAEEFIRSAKGRKLAAHNADDINRYLEEQGRKDRIADWQFRQIIDAIQILFETVEEGVGEDGVGPNQPSDYSGNIFKNKPFSALRWPLLMPESAT